MIKKHRSPITCDMCGTDNIFEYTTITNAISRKINVCKKCAIKDGLIIQSDQEILGEIPLLTPQQIYDKLDAAVINQHESKIQLSIEIFNHVLRLKNKDKLKKMGKSIKKNNILLTGNSGTGKTYLAQNLAKILNLPFFIGNASTLTEAGYVGEDSENLIVGLLNCCDFNVKLAQKGIIFIDEIDKIAKKGANVSLTRDVSGEGVQQALLKIVEGDLCRIPPNGGRKHPQEALIDINTEDILFICGGAFVGIEDIVKDRLKKMNKQTSTIGFGANNAVRYEYTMEELRANITVDDLQAFGMIPEFLGRFPIVSNLQPLDVDALVKIMQLPNGILEEYKTYFELLGKELTVQDSALKHIAKLAVANGTGARGLRTILKSLLGKYMFSAPSDSLTTKYTITQKTVEKFYKIALEETA